jgi:hypothetical protein
MQLVLDAGSLGVLDQAFARFPDFARQELSVFGHAATQYLKGEVIDRTPAAEGALRDSAFTRVEELPSGMIGVVAMSSPYVEAVELGTKPHMPPIEPLEQWVKTKLGLSGKEGANAARGIQWKIFHHGTKGAHMFESALDAGAAELERQFGATMQRLADRLAGAAQ